MIDYRSDLDAIECVEMFPIIEDIDEASQHKFSLLIVREVETYAGYVKLQLVIERVPCISIHWPFLRNKVRKGVFKNDKYGRIVFFDIPIENLHKMFYRLKNKPALKSETLLFENVICYRCSTWPSAAQEWLSRHRIHGYPSENTIQDIKSFGFFVVKKGHPFSSEVDLEWRISLSLQERKLMFNLSDVQHKRYFILKMFNRRIIKLDCITSYHWKTCLFYVMEENNHNVWEKRCLCHSVKLCIKQMLKWVKHGFCPNYFIPMDNLFDGKLNESLRLISELKIQELLEVGFDCLRFVTSDNICDYVKSRKAEELPNWLTTQSKKVYKESVTKIDMFLIDSSNDLFNRRILEYYYCQANENMAVFIEFLWSTLDRIKQIGTITEHTEEETNSSLALLTPYIYACLASNISAMAIRHHNLPVRYFLLFGSFIYFVKGDVPGRLKLISVLYALGLYTDCEWFIDQEDEQYMKYNPSVCTCRYTKIDDSTEVQSFVPSKSKVCTCISFLPSELPIMPDAMKYEMFRYVGVCLQEIERPNISCRWLYTAVVDYNVYFFLLKYLTKRNLRKTTESEEAQYSILKLLNELNVRHVDVACNLLAWIFITEMKTPMALLNLQLSFEMLNASQLCFTNLTDETQRKLYQFNTAKLHALVLLYNTWFSKQSSSFYFCFHCIFISPVKLQKCSRCKITTYCSKQCQRQNWKIHKAVCKIVRKYQKTYH